MIHQNQQCSVLGWHRHKPDFNCDYDMHTRMVRNDSLHCNGFWVVTATASVNRRLTEAASL
jgi:hypothetical protein